MIDSVLKGTGNSRFLKSAVPAGTSWADALAMLQAGTFPIDFNGINTEGFQQVGTPLNKANLLKDATALTLGLTGDVVPNDMFNVLAHAGDLHVWRKTVKNAADVPAGYTLGEVQSNLHVPTSGQTVDFVYSASITVGNDGTVSQPSSSTKTAFATSAHVSGVQSVLAGNFFTIKNGYGSVIDGVWYCPSSLTVSVAGNDIILSQAQKVNAHGIIPAGTTVTYPVSTNRNAYQEGDDAKPAGYTLGEVVTGKFIVGRGSSGNTDTALNVSSSLSVSDTGSVSLSSPQTNQSFNSAATELLGKFVLLTRYGVSSSAGSAYRLPGQIVYIPASAETGVETISAISSSSRWVTIDRYQPVTGYAAIPANTTIEYLGCLGDKARVQVVSYVGTGTYGTGHETKIAFKFPPKLLVIAMADTSLRTIFISVPNAGVGLYLSADGSSSIYGTHETLVTYDGGTITLYSYSSEYGQMNVSGKTYIAVALG